VDFSLEKCGDTHDNFYYIPERGVQQAGEGVPDRERDLFYGVAT
jgi:hypothetical protein